LENSDKLIGLYTGFDLASGEPSNFTTNSGNLLESFNTLNYGSYNESGLNILPINNNFKLKLLYNTNNVELEILNQSTSSTVPEPGTIAHFAVGLCRVSAKKSIQLFE